MSEHTGISWTDHTFNPWWGCAKVSPGCANCYAETFAKRYGQDVWGKTTPRRLFGTKHWNEPVKWNRQLGGTGVRHRVFCASMADVFEDHPMVADDRVKLWDLIHRTPNLDWQILTKRPENIARLGLQEWPPNVWLGVSVEDQQRADERIPLLLKTPAAVHFLSCEPLLGPISLARWVGIPTSEAEREAMRSIWPAGLPDNSMNAVYGREQAANRRGLWVIIGGESGHKHRPMDPEWLAGLAHQTTGLGIPTFVKQDSGPRSGTRGRIASELWTLKQFPEEAPCTTT